MKHKILIGSVGANVLSTAISVLVMVMLTANGADYALMATKGFYISGYLLLLSIGLFFVGLFYPEGGA